MAVPSPFLEIPRSAWIAENALAFAVRDRFPVACQGTSSFSLRAETLRSSDSACAHWSCTA
jgi:hypothetical protein